MAKIKKLPVGLNVIGTKVVVSPKFREVVNGSYDDFVPFREFEISGENQSTVTIRVYGLANSDVPKTRGLTFVKSISGLNMVTRLVGTKEEIQFEATELRFEK